MGACRSAGEKISCSRDRSFDESFKKDVVSCTSVAGTKGKYRSRCFGGPLSREGFTDGDFFGFSGAAARCGSSSAGAAAARRTPSIVTCGNRKSFLVLLNVGASPFRPYETRVSCFVLRCTTIFLMPSTCMHASLRLSLYILVSLSVSLPICNSLSLPLYTTSLSVYSYLCISLSFSSPQYTFQRQFRRAKSKNSEEAAHALTGRSRVRGETGQATPVEPERRSLFDQTKAQDALWCKQTSLRTAATASVVRKTTGAKETATREGYSAFCPLPVSLFYCCCHAFACKTGGHETPARHHMQARLSKATTFTYICIPLVYYL